MIRKSVLLAAAAGVFCGTAVAGTAQAQAVGSPAERAIIAAFKHHSVVLLGEMHNSAEFHAFVQSLIANPDFPAVVQDVVLEALNVRYQPLLDRYVAGETVPMDSVALAWRNTTQLFLWDAPVYAQTLAAIRAVNATLPAARRLRVLASDPPVDWATISKPADFPHSYGYRDWQTVAVIREQVLARHRKALVVFGSYHGEKTRPRLPDEPADTIAEVLAEGIERISPGATYSVVAVAGNVNNALKSLMPRNARPRTLFDLARNGWSGRSSSLIFGETVTLYRRQDGQRVPVTVMAESLPALGAVIDAILYVGAFSNPVAADATPYVKDAAFLAETRRRISLMKDIYGVDIWTDDLNQMLRCGQ